MYDVVIVGAGPAGCQLARQLAKKNKRVLLAERFPSFETNNFSSAGSPIDTIKEFSLPKKVVAATWNGLLIESTNKKSIHERKKPLGVVFDFAKLRKFLVDSAKKNGAEMRFGWSSISCEDKNDKVVTTFKTKKGTQTVESTFVVDATGHARSVIRSLGCRMPKTITGIGIEYLVKSPGVKQTQMQFFLGKKWMPDGYGWIFPMGNNTCKVGVAYMKYGRQHDLQQYLDKILSEKLKKYIVLDKHGGAIVLSPTLQDTYAKGNIIAIGDAVSTVNALGGEGIRFAMHSANIAAQEIVTKLDNPDHTWVFYREQMRKTKSTQRLSATFNKIVYGMFTDWMIDRLVSRFNKANVQTVMDLLFYFKYKKLGKLIFP